MAHSKEEVMNHIKKVMVDLFELDEADLVPEAKFHEDLDIDSIDTIDLLIELKKFVGKEIDADKFIDATTLGEVVDIIASMD